MQLNTVITAMEHIGGALLGLPAVASVFEEAIHMLHTTDQPAAKARYKELITKSDSMHENVQDKLDDASKS